MKVIILVGPSGAGKSTYIANYMRGRSEVSTVCSADHFFIDAAGRYSFDRNKLGEAHAACMRSFVESVREPTHASVRGPGDVEIVFVDNTNTTKEELAPYIAVSRAYGVEPEIMVLGLDIEPSVLAARNLHGVPEAACKRMQDNVRRMIGHWPPHWPKVGK